MKQGKIALADAGTLTGWQGTIAAHRWFANWSRSKQKKENDAWKRRRQGMKKRALNALG